MSRPWRRPRANRSRRRWARAAGAHGLEMLRLGYTLSHVVHAYGAMCQATTEVATEKDAPIEASEFHALNRCLDVAIAGAVTDYDSERSSGDSRLERPRAMAAEMRGLLMRANVAFQAIQRGSAGIRGGTADSLQRCLGQLEQLVDEALLDGDAKRPDSSN